MKELKFADPLAELIAQDKKRTTWRVNDDRELTAGDNLKLVHKSTGRLFGMGVITSVNQRTFGTLQPEDLEGHEPFPGGFGEMITTYQGYYDDPNIGSDTEVTVVKFTLNLVCTRPGSDETDVMVMRP